MHVYLCINILYLPIAILHIKYELTFALFALASASSTSDLAANEGEIYELNFFATVQRCCLGFSLQRVDKLTVCNDAPRRIRSMHFSANNSRESLHERTTTQHQKDRACATTRDLFDIGPLRMSFAVDGVGVSTETLQRARIVVDESPFTVRTPLARAVEDWLGIGSIRR